MKTNLDSIFKMDNSLETNGIWLKYGKTRFLVRRFGGENDLFAKAMAKYHKPYARQMELGTLDDKQKLEILAKVFSSACLVKWENVEADGKPLECNFQNSVDLLLALPDLFDALYREANVMSNYKEDADDLGNSSSGT